MANPDHIAFANPFRYRGYYYDQETSFYLIPPNGSGYTRYYDPEIGRFISPASIESLNPYAINGLNLYAFPSNNPLALSPSSANISSGGFGGSGFGGYGGGFGFGGYGGGVGASGYDGSWPTMPGWVSTAKDVINYGYNLFDGFSDVLTVVKRFRQHESLSAGTLSKIVGWKPSVSDYIFLGLDVGFDVYDSLQSGLSWKGTLAGAALTAAKGVGMIYLSKGIIYGCAMLGSLFGPVGTVVGFAVGFVVSVVVDIFLGKWLDEQIGKLKRWIG